MKSIKRLITLVLCVTLVLTPMMVSAKKFTSKQNLTLTHVWTVKFNKQLENNQDFSKVSIVDTKGNSVQISVALGSDKQSIAITPKENYNYNTTYTLTVDGIKDLNGKSLKENAQIDFTTIPEPVTPVENYAIVPEAITFNADGTTNTITTNDYVNKAYPGKGYGNYNAILNPDYDKNYGMKHDDGCDHTTPCFIDNNNILNFAYSATENPKTFSEGLTYNKYMQDEIRELMKSYIGTTPYDKLHYIDMSEMKECDGIHDEFIADYRDMSNDSNVSDFTYMFPIKPLKSMQETVDGEVHFIYYYTYLNMKDNASLALCVDADNAFTNTEITKALKQSLCAVFGKNYYTKIYDYMNNEEIKRLNVVKDRQNNKWDGNDTITIGNVTIYVSAYGKYYSFFLK